MKKYYSLFFVLLIVHAFNFAVSARDLSQIKEDGVLRHLGVYYARFVTGSGDGGKGLCRRNWCRLQICQLKLFRYNC